MKNKFYFFLMYVAFFVYSLSGVFSKLASRFEILSLPYFGCLMAVIGILGIYAVLWQQVLKRIQLSVAMANKPVVLVIGTLWAVIIFGEKTDLKFFIGMILIILGLFVIGFKNE